MTREEIITTAKPILFSTNMVSAILDGLKTQTRRVIKPQPDNNGIIKAVTNAGEDSFFDVVNDRGLSDYRVGGILWVRETWGQNGHDGSLLYRADGDSPYIYPKWRPSIHMPKEAARIFLRVTGVRVKRLQDISANDCVAEGIASPPDYKPEYTNMEIMPMTCNALIRDYARLWNSTNEKHGYAWIDNPWVWVYEFERVTIDEQNSTYP